MLYPDKHQSSTEYRFGFNGMEKDDAIKGLSGTSYDYGKRFYDPRVGRFLSLDPLASDFPYESNYNYVSNNPIIYSDPTGGAKIITFIITDRTTGKTYAAIAVVVDKWDIARGKPIHSYPAGSSTLETTYEWHDINITQNVMREPDGSYTKVGEPIKDRGKQVLATQPWEWAAQVEIVARDVDAGLPGEGEAAMFKWMEGDGSKCDDCGGVMFYSKKGEGSGVRGTNAKLIDYVNGDVLIEFIKAGSSIAKGMPNNVGQNGPLPFGEGGWKGKVSPELQKLFDQSKKIYDNLKTAESAVEKVGNISEKVKKEYNYIKHNGNLIPFTEKVPDSGKLDGGGGGNQGATNDGGFEHTPRGPVNGGNKK